MRYRLQRTSALLIPLGLVALAAVGCTASSRGNNEGPAQVAAATPEAIHHESPAEVADKKAEQPGEAVNQIVIDNFSFKPAQLTISAGTKVTWVNRDDVPHTATSTTKPRVIDSKTLDTDEQFSQVFNTPGTYAYFCALHPKMTGQIIVK
jgi:plastocyanin